MNFNLVSLLTAELELVASWRDARAALVAERVWLGALKRCGGRPRFNYDVNFTCDCGSHVLGCRCQERLESEVADADQL